MNATIQCLCHINYLKDYFLNKDLITEATKNKNCPLTLSFYNLINNLWKLPKDNNNKKYFKPTEFKNTISKMNDLFKGVAANDSKDLILFIYETIHEELNKQNPSFVNFNLNNCFNDYELMNFRNSYYSINSSIFIDTFYFEQQSFLQCVSCQFTKISYNITNIIIFPLEKVREYVYQSSNGQINNVTLDNCFMHYYTGERLSGANQIYCNNCKNLADAIIVNKIFTSPEVLTIILNRGKGLEFKVAFSFQYYIDINNYIVDKSSGKNNTYELIGILCHFGPSGMSGHFIAYCKSPIDNNWYCYNDATVVQCKGLPDISTNANVDGIPYVLYYQRINNNNQNIEKDSIIKTHMKNFVQENTRPRRSKTVQINNFTKSDDKKKKNKDEIHLIFNYEQKSYELDVNKNIKVKAMINALNKKYNISKNVMILKQIDNDNLVTFKVSDKINIHNLKDNDVLTIVDL